jgi:hypothetical protein
VQIKQRLQLGKTSKVLNPSIFFNKIPLNQRGSKGSRPYRFNHVIMVEVNRLIMMRSNTKDRG